MKSPLPISLLIAITLSLSSTALPKPGHPAPAAAEGVQSIDVTAKKYEFDPGTIRVKQGTRVQLKITATDHVHGFAISEMPEGLETQGKPGLVFASPQHCARVEEGKSVTVEFVAQTPGTYAIRCCVHCGWRHKSMKGQLIVEP